VLGKRIVRDSAACFVDQVAVRLEIRGMEHNETAVDQLLDRLGRRLVVRWCIVIVKDVIDEFLLDRLR